MFYFRNLTNAAINRSLHFDSNGLAKIIDIPVPQDLGGMVSENVFGMLHGG